MNNKLFHCSLHSAKVQVASHLICGKFYAVSQYVYGLFCQIEKCSHCHSLTAQTLSTLGNFFLIPIKFKPPYLPLFNKSTRKQKQNKVMLQLPCQEAVPYLSKQKKKKRSCSILVSIPKMLLFILFNEINNV